MNWMPPAAVSEVQPGSCHRTSSYLNDAQSRLKDLSKAAMFDWHTTQAKTTLPRCAAHLWLELPAAVGVAAVEQDVHADDVLKAQDGARQRHAVAPAGSKAYGNRDYGKDTSMLMASSRPSMPRVSWHLLQVTQMS